MNRLRLPDPIAPGCDARTHVLVALSGGADSTALLLLLHAAREEGRIAKLSCAHFHHGLRGAEADRDLAFSEALAARLGVPFFSERGDVPAYRTATGKSTETAARELRYAFLRRVRAQCGADVIATAHHMDDQAETVLMHLIRGTGTNGLCGIRARSGDLVRPLLGFTHEELTRFLSESGEPWCEDTTNAAEDAARNRLRHSVMPLLKEANPNLGAALSRLAAHAQSDEAHFAPLAERLLETAKVPPGFDRAVLAAAEEPVRRRALMRILSGLLGGDLTEADVKKLEDLLTGRSGRTALFSGGHTALADGAHLILDPSSPEELPEAALPGNGALRYGAWVLTAETAKGFRRPEDPYSACIAWDGQSPLTVRFPKPGDRFSPLGLGGTKLLSDIFTDRKTPLGQRRVPLVLMGGEIVFLPGYTVSERVRVSEPSKSKTTVRLTVRRG
ncbi:MAG: tRNA lysidine(34) synthetase TilS [Clostridia bacterium]|nr:tRNA lysidine(34) synthetase TilS [Clostridia bacterium]